MKCFQAYWAYQAGLTKSAVGKEMGVAQGTITKWTQKVQKWLDAGNKMPNIVTPTPLKSQPKSMAPSDIEMGARLDHRAPHQRQKRSEIQRDGWNGE